MSFPNPESGHHRHVVLCVQAMTRVNPTVYNSIAALSNEPNTTVVVFSGSDKAKLDDTFGNLNVWLAAENGIFMRPPPDEDGDQEVGPLGPQCKFLTPGCCREQFYPLFCCQGFCLCSALADEL